MRRFIRRDRYVASSSAAIIACEAAAVVNAAQERHVGQLARAVVIIRERQQVPARCVRDASHRGPAVTYLQTSSARTAASVRRVSDTTSWHLLTFTNYDDGTSELTHVSFLGCVDDGGGFAGDNGGGGGGAVAIAPDKPAH